MAEDQEKKQEKPKATLIKHKKPEASTEKDAHKEAESASSEEKGDKSSAPDSSQKKPEKKKKVVVVKKKSKKSSQKPTAKKSGEGKETAEEKSRNKQTEKSEKAADTAEAKETVSGDQKAHTPSTQAKAEKQKTGSSEEKGTETARRDIERGEAGSAETAAAKEKEKKQQQPNRSEDTQAATHKKPEAKSGEQRKAPSHKEGRPQDRTSGKAPQGRGGPSQGRGGPSQGRGGQSQNRGGPSQGRGNAPQGRSGQGRPPKPDTGKQQGPPPSQEAQEKKQAGKKFYKSKKKGGYSKKKEEAPEKDIQIKKKAPKKTNPIPKEIDITEVITISELAKKMNLKASELIGKLMNMGIMATINQQIDAETAELLANEYECKVKVVSLYDETIIETENDSEDDLMMRPPIVTVMGHVDHGKTKLLDAIRTTDVVTGEHGGITQHIGAYKVRLENGEIVFLDTPGHEAFTLMRARGAQITDIVILVVAANDGVMPQTVEAIDHAKEAGVPIIVAVNKVDLPEAKPERVKQQLAEYDLLPEDWGGSTLFSEISALNQLGIEELLESVLLQSEILELKANYKCRAEGKVVESKVDHGRGIVSTVIVERGTLRVGNAFVAGVYPGKVRAMFDDTGKKVEEATPATPVEVLGFSGIPDAGAPFQVTESERQARQVGAKRQELEKQGEAQNVKRVTLDTLYDSIQQGEIQELKVIIKGDVHGSVEALQTALEKLSTSEIRLNVIHASAGAIVESDVHMAAASNAIIVGFHVRPTPSALSLAEKEKVEVRKYNIIYEAVDDIKDAMEGMLSPEIREEVIGSVEVRDTFKVPKIGFIAGSYVTEGKIKRNSMVHVIREGIQIYTGKVVSLKRFKEDAREVDAGYECGVGIENFNDIQVGDQFEVFETKEIAKKLE